MKDELKEKLAKQQYEWIDDDGWEWKEITKTSRDVYRSKADSILSLIDGERCVWTEETRSNGVIIYKTSCDKQAVTWDQKDFNENPFCQACGKQIEVKEVKDGQG